MQPAPKAIPLVALRARSLSRRPSQAKGEEDATPFETTGGATANARAARATQTRREVVIHEVLRLADIGFEAPTALLAHHGLELVRVENGQPIPGSFWGEPEAGVIASKVYARADTPVHSLLHEACHLLLVDPAKRASIHTDASDSLEEEDATCYLQIVLADALPGFGRARALADMDAWGYSFRLGSARAWFEHDAEDARVFLEARGLVPVAT
jgi:hypothetical protein